VVSTLPRISGSLEELNNVTRIWVHITQVPPRISSSSSGLPYAGRHRLTDYRPSNRCRGVTRPSLCCVRIPAGYLTLGIISYRKTFEIGAREATSILARVLGIQISAPPDSSPMLTRRACGYLVLALATRQPTLTALPNPGSPALDNGSCGAVSADQSGFTRPQESPATAAPRAPARRTPAPLLPLAIR